MDVKQGSPKEIKRLRKKRIPFWKNETPCRRVFRLLWQVSQIHRFRTFLPDLHAGHTFFTGWDVTLYRSVWFGKTFVSVNPWGGVDKSQEANIMELAT